LGCKKVRLLVDDDDAGASNVVNDDDDDDDDDAEDDDVEDDDEEEDIDVDGEPKSKDRYGSKASIMGKSWTIESRRNVTPTTRVLTASNANSR